MEKEKIQEIKNLYSKTRSPKYSTSTIAPVESCHENSAFFCKIINKLNISIDKK